MIKMVEHGEDLVRMLAENEATLESTAGYNPVERDLGRYTLRTLFLTYGFDMHNADDDSTIHEEVNLAVSLIRWGTMEKWKYSRNTQVHHNLTVANLSGMVPDESTIDHLMQLEPGTNLPELRRAAYVVAEDEKARKLYEQFDGDHAPLTGTDFSNLIGERSIGYDTKRTWQSKMPNQRTRIATGRF